MISLKLLQYTCMIVMLTLAFFTTTSHFLIQRKNRQLERSRWMIVGAMMILATHFLLQITLQIRERGDNAGTLFNIMFYAPAVILLTCSQLNIQMAGGVSKKFITIGMAGYVATLFVTAMGWLYDNGCYIKEATYVVDAMNMAILVYYIWEPYKKLRRIKRRLDNELGNPADTYNRTMQMGTLIIYIVVILSPFFILSRKTLFFFGPLGLIAITLFVTCFNALGFNSNVTEILNEINEINDDEKCDTDNVKSECHMRKTEEKDEPTIPDERKKQIESAIEKWKDEDGYKDANLTLANMTKRIMINKADFTLYLTKCHGKTFRVWLSDIRTEEAKRMMTENPEYSNELVSMECGFSSRVYFQRMFKEKTGLTPSEWKKSIATENQ